MKSATRVLLVEDEPQLAALLADYLGTAGFAVTRLERGDQVPAWLAANSPDLIILDVMLPGLDGFALTRQIRQGLSTPILLTTARVDENDRLLGLTLGADDYICKPYSPREVVARVQAVLRRSQPQPVAVAPSTLQLDEQSFQLRHGAASVQLTAVEFRLMQAMRRAPGCILSRQQLIDQIYVDGRVVSERTVDSHIKKLRRKLEQLASPEQIEAVYGLGYRLNVAGALA